MTLRTGKSGRYRYYTCASQAQRGKSACKGRSVPMAKLDDLVTEHLADQLLTKERVEGLLEALITRQDRRKADHTQRVGALKAKFDETEKKLGNLYEAIENGMLDASDPMLKERIESRKTERDIAKTAYERACDEQRPGARINAEKIEAFTNLMRTNVTEGEIPFRRAWLRSLVDNV